MDARLILTDIDGTILPRGRQVVDTGTRLAMRAALDAGIRTGVATGRAIPAVLPAFGGDHTFAKTALATSGTQVYLDGRLIHEERLGRDALVRVAQVVRDVPGAGLITFDGPKVNLVEGKASDLELCFPAYARDLRPVPEVPRGPIVKANVFIAGGADATEGLLGTLQDCVPELGFNMPMTGFLNVVPLGYSKATGIDILCEALGITVDDVVVFGDADNDVEMLSHVPNSVAVADATERARRAARWHIGRCADGAVADAISALARGEWSFTC